MSQKLSFVTLDVFTHQRYTGNPLAVVLLPGDFHEDQDKASADKEVISTEALQRMAREFNLSETVFVYPGRVSEEDGVLEWRVRIFLVHAEITFAGE
jgi:PhzF family phenazine biosynthesis protein